MAFTTVKTTAGKQPSVRWEEDNPMALKPESFSSSGGRNWQQRKYFILEMSHHYVGWYAGTGI